MKTKKLYYLDQFLVTCRAKLIEINEKGLIFDNTVAYPEGGGQIGDRGILIREKNKEIIEFSDTTKIRGRNIYLENFPIIKVEGMIIHHVDISLLDNLELGEEFIIKLDVERRAKTTLHHSALHLALMVLTNIRNGIDKKIVGAKITDTYGRLDFSTEEKFTKEELQSIETRCNNLIKNELEILSYQHPDEEEAIYWKCLDYSIPCGGTHCNNTKYLGKMKIKRKNIGKSSERLIVELSEIENFLKIYGEVNE